MVQVIEVPPSTPIVRDTPAAAALADPAVVEYRPPQPDTGQASVLSVVMTGAGGGGSGGLPFSTRTVFADTVAVAGELLQVDATAATITISPPASPAAGDYVTLAKIDDSDYSVVFSAPVSGDVEGAEIVAAHAAATFVWDGDSWLIVSVNTSYSGDAAVLAAIPEIARDTVGNTLVAGDNVTLTPDDDQDIITIAAQVPNTAGLASQAALDAAIAGVPEQARDALAAGLVAGAGIALAVNDTADTITITATAGSGGGEGGSGVTTEDVQDVVATLLAAGTHTGISFVYDDVGDALSATVPAPAWSQITGRPAFAAVSVSGSASDLTTGTVDDARLPATIARDVELAAHTDNTSNPHNTTKAQVGLGNVDNTSDSAKPVSTAVASALSGKASSSHGHQTSDIAAAGFPSSATFLRGDGAWAEPSVFTTAPPGGVQISGYSPTVAPNASAGTHFRYSASGTMTINPPVNAEDGQKLLLEIQAVGGARTIGFASSIEISAAAPTRTTSIPSGQWGYFALLHRAGTWRLMAMDPVPV